MPTFLSLLDKLARWQVVAALALPTLGLMAAFNFHPAGVPRLRQLGGGIPPLDMHFVYGPDEVSSLLTTYGAEGRHHYGLFLAIDMFYAVSYGLFLAALLRLALRRLGILATSRWNYLCLLPLGSGAADMTENATILALLHIYPATPPALVYVASAATSLKWVLASVSLVLILALLGLGALWPKSS
jgi:hypothetical protein